MTLTLELPHELEEELSAEAAQLGLPLPDYALRVLYRRPVADNRPRTGAELVAFWQNEGLIGTRKDIADSQTYARQLRTLAENH